MQRPTDIGTEIKAASLTVQAKSQLLNPRAHTQHRCTMKATRKARLNRKRTRQLSPQNVLRGA